MGHVLGAVICVSWGARTQTGGGEFKAAEDQERGLFLLSGDRMTEHHVKIMAASGLQQHFGEVRLL
ncbi:hypothetical protein PHAMO_270111 [Magnetospirillum molischianum DSM 120]|uniref:Uncharacterized protein n=1 Tax=Magnetospirillum molischianum DSM 120 TaxID=1150626 RepID=H8FSD2_MAGML|nr:hypothetical protein PHAMO_270111 [Magnetospirillum molischianum DSM 120]